MQPNIVTSLVLLSSIQLGIQYGGLQLRIYIDSVSVDRSFRSVSTLAADATFLVSSLRRRKLPTDEFLFCRVVSGGDRASSV